jgi:hypothetical protein
MVFGVVWAGLLVAAVSIGQLATAALVVPVAVVAAVSGVRAVERSAARPARKAAKGGTPRPTRTPRSTRTPSTRSTRSAGSKGRKTAVNPILASAPLGVAAAAAVVVPASALAGSIAAVATTVVVFAIDVFFVVATARSTGPAGRLLLAGFAPTLAAMSLVLARGQGYSLALALVGAVCLFDMACFVVGNGRGPLGGMPGIIGGVITLAVLAVFVAAVMVPPFSGARPWAVFALLAVTAPAGVALAAQVAPGVRLPALRRLDSLWLAGPAWVIAVAVVLHR